MWCVGLSWPSVEKTFAFRMYILHIGKFPKHPTTEYINRCEICGHLKPVGFCSFNWNKQKFKLPVCDLVAQEILTFHGI